MGAGESGRTDSCVIRETTSSVVRGLGCAFLYLPNYLTTYLPTYLPLSLSLCLGLVSGRGLGHHRDEGQRDAHPPEGQADDELVEDGREEEADGTGELLGGRPPERERGGWGGGNICAWVVRGPASQNRVACESCSA